MTKYVWEHTETPQDRIMWWVPDLHFKKRKRKENFKNANQAAEISFTIVLCEEFEHALCGVGVMVLIKNKENQKGFAKL